MNSSGGQRATRSLALVALVLLAILWASFLATPWSRVSGFADWIGAQNARIATNMQRLGLAETRGAQLMNLEEPASPDDWILYHGHPATLDLLTSLVFEMTATRTALVQRLLPLLAALLSFVLLAKLATRCGVDPYAVVLLFASFPLIAAHGINFSYEPLCLTALLGLVLLYGAGWRWRLVPLFYLAGLLDFPALYLAPFVAALHLMAPSGPGRQGLLQRLRLPAALAFACLAALSTHIAHVLWSGQRAGNPGLAWYDKIVQAFSPKSAFMPDVSEYLSAAWRWFSAGFGIPGLLLGITAIVYVLLPRQAGKLVREEMPDDGPKDVGDGLGVAQRRLLRSAVLAFVFVGAVHCLAFRAHFVLHDFWPVYFTPALALASAALLARLRPLPRFLSLLLVLGFGADTSLSIWLERAAPPVRQVAADLEALGHEDGSVFHQLRAPPGWALENLRGKPVYEGSDLVLHLARIAEPASRELGLAGYRAYLDNLAGTRGDLGRPQRLVLYGALAAGAAGTGTPTDTAWGGQQPGDLEILAKYVVKGPGLLVSGASGARYRLWNLKPSFFDPGLFPAFAELPRKRVRVLGLRARLFDVLEGLDRERRSLWLDGSEGVWERFRGRRLRSAGMASLERRSEEPGAFVDMDLVCWPSAPLAAELRRRAGRRLHERRVPRLGGARAGQQQGAGGSGVKLLIWPGPRS